VRDAFDKLVGDENLISLHDEAAVTAAHMGDIVARMDESIDTTTVSHLESVLDVADEARAEGDYTTALQGLDEIRNIIADCRDFRAAWNEYYKVQARFQSLVEAERREIHTKHKQIAEAEFLAIMTSLAISTRKIVCNERLLGRGPTTLMAAFSIVFDRITTGQPMTHPLPEKTGDAQLDEVIDVEFREVMDEILEDSVYDDEESEDG
jgi:hypothetical protein